MLAIPLSACRVIRNSNWAEGVRRLLRFGMASGQFWFGFPDRYSIDLFILRLSFYANKLQ